MGGNMNKIMLVSSFLLVLGGVAFSQHNTLTQEEIDAGWQLLFDGTRNGPDGMAQHWVDYQRNQPNTTSLTSTWQVNENDGEMFLTGSSGDIRTKEMFRDFHLKFEYRINGNQGFMYRGSLCGGSSWESAVEVALDNNYGSPKHSPGDAYDLYASAVQNFKYFDDPDPWNLFEIIAVEDSIEHWQNGEYLLGFIYWTPDFVDHYNDSKWTGFNCFARPYDVSTGQISNSGYIDEGYFAIQSNHGGDLYIRNFKIQNLIMGCTDAGYEEYDSDANRDDGSCQTPVATQEGCMDVLANNYDANAQVDNGSCTYSGCKDAAASNYFCTVNPTAYCCAGTNGYNLDALTDDGSCACCNDPNYQEYVANCSNPQPGACVNPVGIKLVRGSGERETVTYSQLAITISDQGTHSIEISDVNGRLLISKNGMGEKEYNISELNPGIYYVEVNTPKNSLIKKVLLF
jgi:hypothetical protein